MSSPDRGQMDPPRLAPPRRTSATVVPSPGQGARRARDLDDVDLAGAPVDTPVVWRLGGDGIWRVQPADDTSWSTPVQFSTDQPDPDTAPRGALWVELGDQLRIHERR